MSLQKMHLRNKMSHGPDRKMTAQELHTLMTQAFRFLGVEVPRSVTDSIFKETDTDQDALITYVQYFQVTAKYICKQTLVEKTEEKPQGPERHSRLRILLWTSLRRLYEAYVSGRSI